jgi:hypothetical protein
MSPINARPLLEVGESCGVFISATTSVFDGEAVDFWDLAREARNSIAANQNREYIAAGLSAFQEVVGNGADVATAAEFGAQVFANEIMLTNLGSLSFDRQFGPVTLKALFGPAVTTGFENHQTIGVATVDGALCLLHTSHTPLEGLLEKTKRILKGSVGWTSTELHTRKDYGSQVAIGEDSVPRLARRGDAPGRAKTRECEQ